MRKHYILYKYQYGSREHHSTSHAIMDVIEYIYKSLDDNRFAFGVYIDLKTFDTVNHDILQSELKHYGVRRNALKWFQSYLSDKKTVHNSTQMVFAQKSIPMENLVFLRALSLVLCFFYYLSMTFTYL